MPAARILLVEDESLICLYLEDLLSDAGHVVVGPANALQSALTLARVERIDAAVLDVSLAGVAVWPVASELHARGIPFVILSGYGSTLDVPPACRAAPRIMKPCRRETLLAELDRMLSAGHPAP